MPQRSPGRSALGSLVLIAAIIGVGGAAFAYTAGWLSPQRLTPDKLVAALAPPGGAAPGHRRNHAKGICFTGVFEANGAGAELSKAQVFAKGQYPVLGRLNLATPNPDAADATVRVRGLGMQISTPDGQEWRSAMIDPPVFPVATPQAFYELLTASGSKDPDAMKTLRRGPSGIRRLRSPGRRARPGPAALPKTASTASTASSSSMAPAPSTRCAGRCCRRRSRSLCQPEELAKLGPDFLEQEITQRVAAGPQRWTMVVTVANPGDPTADPTKAWPADRRTVEVGTLVVQKIEAERDGPCRDINFDPTVLPAGIRTSDDPFPAARSAAYAKSYRSPHGGTPGLSAHGEAETTGAKP